MSNLFAKLAEVVLAANVLASHDRLKLYQSASQSHLNGSG